MFAGKCVRQQFDVDAKFCCVKNPSDGSGVIVADAGIIGTPGGGITCPGDSLEMTQSFTEGKKGLRKSSSEEK